MSKFKPEKNLIHADPGTLYKIVNGERVAVTSIIAQDGDSCCYLDCCSKSIKYYSKSAGEQREILLDDLYSLLMP